jgi:hypothetical protein
LTFLALIIARRIVTDLLFSESSFGSILLTLAHTTTLISLVRHIVDRTPVGVGSAVTDGFVDPSASTKIALRTVMVVASGTTFGHVRNVDRVYWW